MHFSLMLLAIGLALTVRLLSFRLYSDWSFRWQHSLGIFVFPPLLLLMMAIAVVCMGQQGQMLGISVGKIGYLSAWSFLIVAIGLLSWRALQGWRSEQQMAQYPTLSLQAAGEASTGYLLDSSLPFAAQVGIWRSKLVVSQGLLQTLTPAQIEAVLAHEQAHVYYRDPFWFFWLSWLRQLTAWLPYTESLWQELLLLRELRADRWAAQKVDALLIAESLLCMTQSPLMKLDHACAAVNSEMTFTRLEERIEALLAKSDAAPDRCMPWIWLLAALMPLLTVMLHQ